MRGTLAIDLGSSTTVVAWQPAAGPAGLAPQLLALPPYSLSEPPVVPSLLWAGEATGQGALLGRQVLEAGLAHSDAPQLHRDFKRRIGADPGAEPGADPERGGPATCLSPEQAGALLLQRLWQALPPELEPQRLVLTAPIDTYRCYRQWLQQACAALPVPELALVDEPTAAAIGAGLAPGSSVLVVDLGGGTVDLALVTLEGGEGRAAPIAQLLRFAGRDLGQSGQALRAARVIAKAGLAIGGRDIDRWIAAHLCPDQPLGGGLLQAAEQLKCRLSDTQDEREEALSLWTPNGGEPRALRLDRRGLERLVRQRGLLEQLDGLLEQVLASARAAGLERQRIAAVLPVGGASRMPLLRRWLEERCGDLAIRGERPVEAVALGALALTPGVRLRDVLSHGVSLRCWEQRSGRHHWHPLFMAGQGWPTETPLELVLACSRDGQEQLELVLGEPLPEQRGEVVFRDGLPVLQSRSAGSARVQPWDRQPQPLRLDPPGERGVDRLRLHFRIDADGQLCLGGSDLTSGAPLPEQRLGPVR